MRRAVIIFGVILVATIVSVAIFYRNHAREILPTATSFSKLNLIRVKTFEPNTIIRSPLVITGEARGNWFFEADFPVRVLDEDGTELGVGIARADEEWMTPDFVPFSVTIQFRASKNSRGAVVFQKNNPSDLREHDDELRIPIRFSP